MHALTEGRVRWIVCALLFMITCVNYADRSALGLVEPMLKHVLGDTDPARYNRHYSEIVNCFIIAYGMGFLISGRIVDRFGARKGMALSILVWALASISHAFMRTTAGFGMARFALGLGESGNFPAALRATADWFSVEERALATGIFNSGTSAASLLAPFAIPWVAVHFGWQATFLFTGSLSLLWLALWVAFPYDQLRLKPRAPGLCAGTSQARPSRSMLSLLKERGTWNFAMSKALTDGVWWFYLFWLPKYLHERFQLDMSQLGLPLIVVYFGATVGSIGGGWLAGYAIKRGLSPRKGRRLALLVCALCTTAVILVPFTHQLWQAIAVLSLATAAHQGWSSNLFSTPSDIFAPESVGTVVGIGGAMGSVGSSTFTALVGALWTNHSLLIFFIAGSAYLVAAAAFQTRIPDAPADAPVCVSAS